MYCAINLMGGPYNTRLQQTWLLSRFLRAQERVPMPRGRSAAKLLNRSLDGAIVVSSVFFALAKVMSN